MYVHMQDQNICIAVGKHLQTVKFVISKMKKMFTPGLPDADTLMVQGRLSNLSHAVSAPSCSMVSGCKGNAGYRLPAYSPAIRNSQGVGRNKEGTLI